MKLYSAPTYKIMQRFDKFGLIQRKNKRGVFYINEGSLLGQVLPSEDLFVVEDSSILVSKKQKEVPATSFLDVGVSDRGDVSLKVSR